MSRFLADNDRAGSARASLYGQLATGMTPETYVSGEAVSVTPIGEPLDRKMYMPPNSGANSTFLETLHVILIHERARSDGGAARPRLRVRDPRAWLADGKTIRVENARTSFGPVSFSIERRKNLIAIHLTPPSARAPKALHLRLRLPAGERIASVRLRGRRIRSTARRRRSTSLAGEVGSSSSQPLHPRGRRPFGSDRASNEQHAAAPTRQ